MQYNFTIRKKDGNYQIIVSYKDGLKWRQKSKQGFVTQREAKLYGQIIIEELKKTVTNPLDDSLKDITLIQFYNIYMEENKPDVYSTFKAYDNAFKKFKSLFNKKVKDITEIHIRNTLNSLDVSISTKNMCITIISKVMKYAVSPYKIINDDPSQHIKRLKKKTESKLNTLTDADIAFLLNGLKIRNQKYYIICSIAAYTGMRYGEILGLTFDDIDFDNSIIDINKQYAYSGKGLYTLRQLKTKNSYRKIPIPPILKNILLEYRKSQKKIRLFNVKTGSTGALTTIIKKYLPNTSIHDLRHTYATKLIANGVDVKTVASLLGDTVDTVINTYIHYTNEMRLKAHDSVSKIFG